MTVHVAQLATSVKQKVAQLVNDAIRGWCQRFAMTDIVRIHQSKQPRRPHHIADWAETRGLSQADIVRETGVDKSVVSRWFKGATPGTAHQETLAALFHCTPEALFRHPDDDWLARFFQDREREEIERIKRTLEAAFPRKIA